MNTAENAAATSRATDPLDDPRLTQILEEYQAALEAGTRPDRRQILARHADIAGPLANCLDGLDMLHSSGSQLLPEAKRPSPEAASASMGGGLPLGDFHMLREVGRGGMGVVYEAQQLSLGRRVALKVLPFAVALDQRQLQRFKNEAQAAALLHHTNIVPVFAVGCERGVYYYAMQFIEGRTIAAVIAEWRQLEGLDPLATPGSGSKSIYGVEPVGEQNPTVHDPVAETARPALAASTERSTHAAGYYRMVARLGVQAAEALEYAHQQGVIHRDIKPANLLLDSREHLWVTDFGLARCKNDAGLTTPGDLVGTVRYMSPEQALARPGQVDHRTDIYSLGATLYELLTLEPVFRGSDRQELLRQIAHDEPRPPRTIRRGVPRELETIVLKALGKNPEERYAVAQDLADDLRRFLEDRPILARRPTLFERGAKWLRRHRGVAAASFVVLLLAVVGLTASTVLIANEQARTHDAYEAEAKQHALAQANFLQARQAVDDLIAAVSTQEMADHPEMQRIRRKLLEAARDYYQKFIDQHPDDPSVRADLVACHLRIATILNEMGATAEAMASVDKAGELKEKLTGTHPLAPELQRDLETLTIKLTSLPRTSALHLLAHQSVQTELKLDDDQQKTVSELVEARHALFHSFKNKSTDEWRQKMDELTAKDKKLPEMLTRPQVKRLQQIALQQHGGLALAEPEVAAALVLTDEQKKKINALAEPLFSGPRDHHRFGLRPDWKKIDEAKEQMLSVLTAEQRSAWGELLGAPFTGEIRRGPPSYGLPPGPDFKRWP